MLLKDVLVNLLFTIPPVKRSRLSRDPDYEQGMSEADHLEGLRWKLARIAQAVPDLSGMTVLELGPGGHFALPLALVGRGAARIIGIDRETFHLAKQPTRFESLYRTVIQGFCDPRNLPPPERYESSQAYTQFRLPLEDRQFTYLVGRGIEHEERVEPASIDLIFSSTVLEHVHDLEAAFAAMARLLRPGGAMVHLADLRDHRDFRHPLEFLRESDLRWRWTMWNRFYTNRERWPRYLELIERHGFDLCDVDIFERAREADLAAIRPRLARRFRGQTEEELAPLGVFFVAKRPRVC